MRPGLENEKQPAMQGVGAAHEGVAVDCDGTLWRGDLGDEVFARVVEEREFSPAALPVFEVFFRRYGLAEPSGDAAVSAHQRVNDFAAELGRRISGGGLRATDGSRAFFRDLFSLQMRCYAGLSESRLRSIAAQVFDQVIVNDLVMPVVDMVRERERRGVPVYAVSASGQLLIDVALERLDIARSGRYGMRCTIVSGLLTASIESPVPYGIGKVEALALLGVERPRLAIGDKPHSTDKEMLACAVEGLVVGRAPHPDHTHCQRFAGT